MALRRRLAPSLPRPTEYEFQGPMVPEGGGEPEDTQYLPPEGLNQPGNIKQPLPELPPVEPVDYSQPGQYMSGLSPFDEAKFYGDHDSPKYQMLRLFSHFDPSQGVTQELIDALNTLGLGTFGLGPSGDRLTISGDVDPRFEGSGMADVIQDFGPGGKNLWGWGGFEGMGDEGGSPDLSQFMSFLNTMNTTGTPSPTPGAPPGSPITPGQPSQPGDIRSALWDIVNRGEGGGLNQDVIQRRIEAAREQMDAGRSSQMDTIKALLAERGFMTGDASGIEARAMGDLEEQLAAGYGGDVRDIFADEAQRADERLIEALSLLTGMSIEDARNAVDRERIAMESQLGNRRIGVEEMLGLGNLGLGSQRLNQEWNMFMSQFGLDREKFAAEMGRWSTDDMLRLLDIWARGAGIGAGGHI